MRLDFRLLQPEKAVNLSTKWRFIKACLKHYLDGNNVKLSPDEKGLVTCLKIQPVTKQDSILIYLLPSIIPARRLGRKRKSRDNEGVAEEIVADKKFTLEERRNSFVLNVLNARDVDAKVAEHTKVLRKLHCTLQPFVVIVGPLAEPKQFFVVLNKHKYTHETVVQAVQSAFHMFFALDLAYPPAAETIWLFLQIAVFEISLPTDRPIYCIKSLKAQIDQLIQKTQQNRPGVSENSDAGTSAAVTDERVRESSESD